MVDQEKINLHIQLLQSVINRMASNSASAKKWCTTIISAMLVLAADKESSGAFLLAIIPVIMFAFIDVYYLALEKGFRNSYNEFVAKLDSGELAGLVFYFITTSGEVKKLRIDSLKSFSVLFFYMPLVFILFLLSCFY